MIEKKRLEEELISEFERLKKELGFDANFEELEEEFSLRDFVYSSGFVWDDFLDQILSRIVEHYRDWISYLNNLLIPNSNFMAAQTEVKLFNSEEDKKNIWKLTVLGMKFSSMKALLALNKNKEMSAEFIDESLREWKEVFKPGIEEVLRKAYSAWSDK